MAKNQPVRLGYKRYDPTGRVNVNLSPILFMHGLLVSGDHWGDIPQKVATASKRKVYALDFRNHGDSEWNDYFNFDINVVDLLHFMDSVGISKAILVGHSIGGITAIKTALRNPDRVENIIVEDMIVRNLSKEQVNSIIACLPIFRKSLESAPSDLDNDGIKAYILNFFRSNLPPEALKILEKSSDGIKRALILRRGVNGRWRFKANIDAVERAVQNYDTLSQEPQGIFDGPALFIYGTMSHLPVRSDEPHIKQHFPNATLVGIEDSAHDVHLDKPQEFIDALLTFIA